MTEEEETLDAEEAIKRLNKALALQFRSALQYSLTSASLTGIEAQAIAGQLIGYGDEELADARILVEKIVSFDGTPRQTSPSCATRRAVARRSTG